MKTLFASTLIAVFGMAATAQAAPVKELGKFGDWNANAYTDSSNQRCFIVATPVTEQPSTLRHGDVHFFVQTQPGNPSQTESSFQTGYPFASDSTVELKIGSETFQMFTSGQSAWLRRLEREPDLLAAMRSGSTMVLNATSARGNDTSYQFSLNGVTAASRLLSNCR